MEAGTGFGLPILGELLRKGLITELTKREGNVRRYIISGKGKAELEKMVRATEGDIARQLKLLAVYSSLAGKQDLEGKVKSLAESLGP